MEDYSVDILENSLSNDNESDLTISNIKPCPFSTLRDKFK